MEYDGVANLSQGTKAVAAAGTAVQLTATTTLVRSVEIHARKNKTTANTGDVYVGFAGGSGNQNRVLAPGDPFTITAIDEEMIDLSQIWIDAANNGDAVTWSAVK